jgi:hypothetical protein
MEDVNVSNDLRQLSHGQIKALEYSHYDINGYHFQTVKLEASRPLAARINIRVVTSAENATSHITDYYGILQVCEHLRSCGQYRVNREDVSHHCFMYLYFVSPSFSLLTYFFFIASVS